MRKSSATLLILITLTTLMFGFQNCAEEIDLGAYDDGSLEDAKVEIVTVAPGATPSTTITYSLNVPSSAGLTSLAIRHRRAGATDWISTPLTVAVGTISGTITGLVSNTAYEVTAEYASSSGSGTTLGKYAVTAPVGGSLTLTLGAAEDTTDTGLFKDVGYGLRSTSLGYNGVSFGTTTQSYFRGYPIERLARSGQTTFTFWLMASSAAISTTYIKSITVSHPTNAIAPRTVYQADAVYSHNGIVGIWNWSNTPFAPLITATGQYTVTIEY